MRSESTSAPAGKLIKAVEGCAQDHCNGIDVEGNLCGGIGLIRGGVAGSRVVECGIWNVLLE